MELTIVGPLNLEVWLQQRCVQFGQMSLKNPENISVGVYRDHLNKGNQVSIMARRQ